jgi:hypothetical protein
MDVEPEIPAVGINAKIDGIIMSPVLGPAVKLLNLGRYRPPTAGYTVPVVTAGVYGWPARWRAT